MAFDNDIKVGKWQEATHEDRLAKQFGAAFAGQANYLVKLLGGSGPAALDYALMDPKRKVSTPQPTTLFDEYLSLVQAFPLISIQNDAHLKIALVVIDYLLDIPKRSDAQEAYLDALTDLVETYETVHVTFPPRTGLDALRFLIESNDLRQEDLVPIFGTKSIVSEVLNEKRARKLTLDHVKKLAAYFHVSPAVFIDDVPA